MKDIGATSPSGTKSRRKPLKIIYFYYFLDGPSDRAAARSCRIFQGLFFAKTDKSTLHEMRKYDFYEEKFLLSSREKFSYFIWCLHRAHLGKFLSTGPGNATEEDKNPK